MILTWSKWNNIRLLVMAFMPVVLFYLVWLVNTSESVRSEEGSLLDLVCWPDGNVIPAVIACAALLAIVIELYGLYQLFKAGLPKRGHSVTNGLYYYIWALIIIIIVFLGIMFYSGLQTTIIRAKLKGGITKAMLRYSSHLPSKVAIDRLQTRFHCCGRITYQEWFYITWYKNAGASATDSFTNHKFVADNVPYSCCSLEAMWPCIHHGITKMGTIYKYNPNNQLTIWTDGCEEKLIKEMMSLTWKFNAVMALIILAMILQIIAARYLHTAYRNGLHIANKIACEAYLLKSISDTEESQNTPTRNSLRRKKLRHARTLEWVTTKYGTKRRRCIISSASDLYSSDELLLKPIYE